MEQKSHSSIAKRWNICLLMLLCFWLIVKRFTMHLYEEFEDTKCVVRICKSKDRQHTDQEK
jgi:hypothetical protein